MRTLARIMMTIIFLPLYIIVSPFCWMISKSMDDDNSGFFVWVEFLENVWGQNEP